MTVKIECNIKKGFREFELQTIVGEVVDIQKTTQTNIESTSGYANFNSGIYISPRIKSSNTQIDTVFIRDPKGREITLEIQNSIIPLRTGNKVSVPCIVEKQGKNSPEFITGIVNHDTKKGSRLSSGQAIFIAFKVGPKYATAYAIWLATTVLGAALTYDYYFAGAIVGFMIGAKISFPYIGKNFNKGSKEIEILIDQHIKSLLNDGPQEAQVV